ncbi:MAG: DUF805 domain-containing protein [Alphaproteobacteria bacterium]
MPNDHLSIRTQDGTELYTMPLSHYLFKMQGRIGRLNYFLMSLASFFVFGFITLIGMSIAMMPMMMRVAQNIPDTLNNPALFENMNEQQILNILDILEKMQTSMNSSMIIFMVFVVVLLIILAWIGLCLSVKRLHDMNISGWLAAIWLFPYFGLFFHIFLVLFPGTKGKNEYGQAPGMLEQTSQTSSD